MQRRKIRRFGIGKKGNSVLDSVLVVVFLAIFSIMIIFSYQTFSNINDEIQADPDMSATAKAPMEDYTTRMPSTLDSIFVMAVVLFWILAIVFSFMIDSHPIFFIIMVVVLIAVFVVAMILSNTYQEITSDAEISSFASEFPMMNWIMERFLFVIIAVSFSVGLALYGKNRLMSG